jgi:hypothetical protein
MTRFFNYERVAAEAGISQDDLERLRARVRADYPNDDMLYELRLLRTCKAIKSGACTVAETLEESDRAASVTPLGTAKT